MADQTSWISENLAQHLLNRLHQPGVARLPMVQAIVGRTERMVKTPTLRQELEQRWQNTLEMQQENLPLVYAQPAQLYGDVVDRPKQQQPRQANTRSGVAQATATNPASTAGKLPVVVPSLPTAIVSELAKSENRAVAASSNVSPTLPRPNNQGKQAKQKAQPVAQNTINSQTKKQHQQTTENAPPVKESDNESTASLSGAIISSLPMVEANQETSLPVIQASQTSAKPEPSLAFPQPARSKDRSGTSTNKVGALSSPVVKPPSLRLGQGNAGRTTKSNPATPPPKMVLPPAPASVSTDNRLPVRSASLPVKKANSVLPKGVGQSQSTRPQSVSNQPTALPLVQATVVRPKNVQPNLPLSSPGKPPPSGGPPSSPQPSQPQGLLTSRPRPMASARPAAPSGGVIQRAPDPAEMGSESPGVSAGSANIDEIADVVLGKIENKLELEMERRGM